MTRDKRCCNNMVRMDILCTEWIYTLMVTCGWSTPKRNATMSNPLCQYIVNILVRATLWANWLNVSHLDLLKYIYRNYNYILIKLQTLIISASSGKKNTYLVNQYHDMQLLFCDSSSSINFGHVDAMLFNQDVDSLRIIVIL